jgi:arylsulfatase A-like enzyme
VPTWNPSETEGYKQVFALPFWHNGAVVEGDLRGPAARVVMDRALEFIRAAAADRRPFLATVWFHEPHEPVVAGPGYRALYGGFSEDEQHYYGCVTAMDEQVGRLRRELGRLGIAADTMVFFCSDNGPEGRTGSEKRFRGSTGGLRGRKRSLFDGGLVVPAVLEWPGRCRGGRVVESPCSTLDYLPTIREVLGFEMPDNRPIDGDSLLGLVEGGKDCRKKPIPFAFHKGSRRGRHGSPALALVDGRWKLLADLTAGSGGEMLFDLHADPGERDNVIRRFPETAARMKDRLRRWFDSCRQSHSGADYPAPFEPVNRFPPA